MSRRPTPPPDHPPRSPGPRSGPHREIRGVHWGLAGFLAGSVFWHLVGFWDFVGRVVFLDPAPRTVELTAARAPPAIRGPNPRSVKLDGSIDSVDPIVTGAITGPAPCIELRRDRAGATSAAPCPDEARPLKPGNFVRRGDRAAPAETVAAAAPTPPEATWSTTVTVDAGEAKLAGHN